MFKGLIYFLLGFFLVGLIVIYELSILEEDLDDLITKYKKHYLDDSDPISNVKETKIPTIVIITPHKKKLHHSAEFERLFAYNNEKSSIKAFSRMKSLLNEFEPTWKQNVYEKNSMSRNQIGRFAHQVSKETTDNIRKPELNGKALMKTEIGRNSAMEQINNIPYWINGIPAPTGKEIVKAIQLKKENERANKITIKIGTPYMDVDHPIDHSYNDKALMKTEIGQFAHSKDNFKAENHQMPSMDDSKETEKRIKEQESQMNRNTLRNSAMEQINNIPYWKNDIAAPTGKEIVKAIQLKKENELANKITNRIGTPYMDVDHPIDHSYQKKLTKSQNYLKEKVYKIIKDNKLHQEQQQMRESSGYKTLAEDPADSWLNENATNNYEFQNEKRQSQKVITRIVNGKEYKIFSNPNYKFWADDLAERYRQPYGKKTNDNELPNKKKQTENETKVNNKKYKITSNPNYKFWADDLAERYRQPYGRRETDNPMKNSNEKFSYEN